jgi:hypothetical protein
MRVDGKFLDADGNKAEGQYVSGKLDHLPTNHDNNRLYSSSYDGAMV